MIKKAYGKSDAYESLSERRVVLSEHADRERLLDEGWCALV